MDDDVEDRGFGLFRGGLFRRIGRALRLVRDDRLDVVRLSLALALVAWVPLVVLGGIERFALGRWDPLLSHLDVHVRWLLAVPLLLAAERLVDERIDVVVRHLTASGMVSPERTAALRRIERRTLRICDSAGFELMLLAIAVASSVVDLDASETPAGWWQAVVSIPIVRFLLLRWLQRWLLWSALLVGLVRLGLALNGLHPDRAGGLGIFIQPSRGFTLVIVSAGTVIASNLGMRIRAGLPLEDITPIVAVFVTFSVILDVAPLLVFTPLLVRAKHDAINHYGAFAHRYVHAFWERWLRREPSESPLGHPDIQSLNDLGGGFAPIREMRLVPFPPKFVGETIVLTLFPILPLWLQSLSIAQIAGYLLKVLF